LTAIADDAGILYKHFYDSLLPLPMAQPPQGASVLDVGSGAGFPGLVFAIVRPDLRVTLLDSNAKKVAFLKETARTLGLSVQTQCARAELAGQDLTLRERFDLVAARAVASLTILCEYCLPFVAVGGQMLAMKGKPVQAEYQAAQQIILRMGGAAARLQQTRLALPEGTAERNNYFIQKISQTPAKYPRNQAILLREEAQRAKKPEKEGEFV
jgi:16S rRNA (guanine527-N7)-methyltransferase